MGILDGGGYRRRRTVLGVNLGHPVVTNGDVVACCAVVHEPIELSFGTVSGLGPGIDVLSGGRKASRVP